MKEGCMIKKQERLKKLEAFLENKRKRNKRNQGNNEGENKKNE